MEISFHVKKTMNAENGEKNQCCVSLKRKKIGLGYTSFRQYPTVQEKH